MFRLTITAVAMVAFAGHSLAAPGSTTTVSPATRPVRHAPAATSAPASVPSSAPSAATSQPAPKEYLEFCQKLQQAMDDGDGKFMDKSMNLDGILAKALVGFDPKDPLHRRFKTHIESEFQLGEAIVQQSRRPSGYKLMRLWQDKDKVRARFRMLVMGRRGVNYHDMDLAKDSSGTVVIDDMFVYAAGESVSDLIRSGWLPVLAMNKNGEAKDNVGGPSADYLRSIDTLAKMSELARQQDYEGAKDVYYSLPESVRKMKTSLILWFSIAQRIDNDEYQKAMDTITRELPNDPSLDLLLIDSCFLRKEYDKSIQAVDRLDKKVGGDPYLNVIRGHISVAREEWDQAEAMMQKAITQEKDLAPAYEGLVHVYLAQNDFAKAVQTLTTMNTLGMEPPDLSKFDEFVKSKEFKAWARNRNGD